MIIDFNKLKSFVYNQTKNRFVSRLNKRRIIRLLFLPLLPTANSINVNTTAFPNLPFKNLHSNEIYANNIPKGQQPVLNLCFGKNNFSLLKSILVYYDLSTIEGDGGHVTNGGTRKKLRSGIV